VLGSGTLDGSGQTTYTPGALAVASHSITATFAGDATFGPSVSRQRERGSLQWAPMKRRSQKIVLFGGLRQVRGPAPSKSLECLLTTFFPAGAETAAGGLTPEINEGCSTSGRPLAGGKDTSVGANASTVSLEISTPRRPAVKCVRYLSSPNPDFLNGAAGGLRQGPL